MGREHTAATDRQDRPLAVAALLLLPVAFIVGLIILFRGGSTPDSETFCDGWSNGLAWGLVQDQTIDRQTAVMLALSDQAPACPSEQATVTVTPEESWCAGFIAGYVEIGRRSGWGEPPVEWPAQAVGECLNIGVPARPLIPGTGVNEVRPGGGGEAPADG